MFGDNVIIKFIFLYFAIALFTGFALATVIISVFALVSLIRFFKQFNKIKSKEK